MLPISERSRAVAPATKVLVGCFGRLPVQDELIRFNLSSPEAAQLESAVEEGVAEWSTHPGASWAAVVDKLATHHFVRYGARGSLLFGTVSSSADRVGRRYPFVSFCRTPLGARSIPTPLVPHAYRSFLNRTADLACRDWFKEQPSGLYKALAELTPTAVPVPASRLVVEEMRLLAGTPMSVLWGSVRGGEHLARRRAFLETFGSALRIAAGRRAAGSRWGLRLPLPSDPQARPAVLAFWLQALGAAGALSEEGLQIFWSASGRAPAHLCVLFMRDLPPALVAPVLDPGLRTDALLDVSFAALGTGARRLVTIPEELESVLEAQGMTLLEALQSINRGLSAL